jgi:hypothetical protein
MGSKSHTFCEQALLSIRFGSIQWLKSEQHLVSAISSQFGIAFLVSWIETFP